jgi:hypothetical protein
MGLMGPQPPCAYCTTESTRACDAPAVEPRHGRHGRCARPLCELHTAREPRRVSRRARYVHGKELLGDIPNYTDIPPTIQIREIVA